jgi:adenylylsulfate reductase subunit B
MGGSVQPLRGSDSIMWTVKFRNGNMKRFKFPIRTTPEGSIEPYANKPKVNMDDIDKPGFFNMGSELKGDRSQLICL